eukprot:CAMPEP_0196593294 /NCGR_PEP_ID=MMETSP1081-20130531/75260_1 /TAXON_ID=36882 /ORGANISM="Pyramimonas amylifera, Strain CCMP720" /LENGTH=141 /DNA_ID=CAMNT_0041917239 /DNA_START=773 /DNA_END=1198 /DNA_ORIENTATION=-
MTSVMSVITLMPHFLKIFGYDGDGNDLDAHESTFVFISVVLDGSFAFSVAGFLAMHLTLVGSNTTTIEMYEKKRSSPWRYDKGRRMNFEQVFGQNILHWFVPMHFATDASLLENSCGIGEAEPLFDISMPSTSYATNEVQP